MIHPVTCRPVPLGLIGPKRDPRGRTLKLANFRTTSPIAYPAACDLSLGLPVDSDPLGNLDWGDCGVAGPGHQIIWMDARSGRPARVTTENVLRTYYTITGGQDVGVYALDVMKLWKAKGICGCKIGAYLQVDYDNPEEMAAAAFELGGVHLCLQLPKSVQGASLWGVPSGYDGGAWGGHWVYAFAISPSMWVVNSWGQQIQVTPAFISRYAFEAWVVVSQDALDGRGRASSGLDLDGLNRALASLSG